MTKITFDPKQPGGLEIVRQIVFKRLREESSWNRFPSEGEFQVFDYYGDGIGSDLNRFGLLVQEVLWELIIQGVIAPGSGDLGSANIPFFHLTEYGKKVLAADKYIPHDPAGYLETLRKAISHPDQTVMAYLTESLNCFTRGALIAVTILLGVAAERVFLLVCESLAESLSDASEQSRFRKLLAGNPMKPKLNCVAKKIEGIQSQNPRPLPDNVNLMLSGVYDFIRVQRNDLGHPQDAPPALTREQVFVNLRIFPSYYETAETVRNHLGSPKK